MNILQRSAECLGIKFTIQDEQGNDVGRAFLYIMYNDLHERPFGFMEDVYIDNFVRGRGFGTSLVKKVICTAKTHGCYKLVATSRYSRHKVHELYISLGFSDHGKEFRIDL